MQTRATQGQSVLAQAGLLAGPFLSMLQSTIVTVAIPEISHQLHSPISTVQWAISGYLLALAGSLPATAYLAKRFGTRRVYRASLVGFTLAAIACALAPTAPVLIVCCALQGALGAPMVPLAMGMLHGRSGAARSMPPAAGMVLFMAPAIGPTLGGGLIALSGWHAIFLASVPVALLGLVGTLRITGEGLDQSDRSATFDVIGLLLLSAGLTATIYGATAGASKGWLGWSVWPFWAGGTLCVAAYACWAFTRPKPAVNLQILKTAQASLSIVLSVLVAVVLFAVLFLLPVFLQDDQGLSPFAAGLVLLPQGIVTGLGTFAGDKLAKRGATRQSAVAGLALLTVSTAALLGVGVQTPAWITAAILCGRGLALGLTIQPLLLVMLRDLDRGALADANTLFNVAQRLGGSVGVALIGTFFAIAETNRISAALRGLGITTSNLTGAVLPPAVQSRLAAAAAAGFHDTVWLLVAVSAIGTAMALLVANPKTQTAAVQADQSEPSPNLQAVASGRR